MWIHQLPPKRESSHFQQRRSVYLKKQFQTKYAIYLVGSLCSALLVAGVPVYYFLNQNYNLFTKLAINHAPELIQTFEIERAWIGRVLALTFLFSLLFYSYFALKWTSQIVGPLLVLQNHIQKATRGDLSSPQLKVRENDEFQDLVATYNYFYLLLRQKTLVDLEKLKLIEPPLSSRLAHNYWSELVNERLMQLQKSSVGMPNDAEKPASLRVS